MRKRLLEDESDLTPLKRGLLRDLYTFRHLDVSRFMYLRSWSPRSLSFCQGIFRELFEDKFVYRHMVAPDNAGRRPKVFNVYCLGDQGYKYLNDCGFDVGFRKRWDQHRRHSFPDWPHEIRLSDFLISASQLGGFAPSFRLATIIHEWLLRRLYQVVVTINVQDGDKMKSIQVGVVPDAYLCFMRNDGVYFPIIFELVRRFASKWRIIRKLLALIEYVYGPYCTLFDMQYVTIAIAVSDNDTLRRDLLLSYCEQAIELSGHKSESAIDLFRVCTLPVGVLDPRQVFLSPLWYRPFDFSEVGISETKARKVYTKPMPILEVI